MRLIVRELERFPVTNDFLYIFSKYTGLFSFYLDYYKFYFFLKNNLFLYI